jgi:xylose dehydrogenase (NAD/NADP)
VRPVGYGVLGAGSFIANRAVIPAIEASSTSYVAAAASRSLGTGTYEDVLAHPDVEVVYVPLPNGRHREWVERAAAAGKHVLCEKPLAPTVDDATAMAAACEAAGVLLAEAWMTPFGTRWRETIARAARGDLGEVREVRTRFSFTIDATRSADYRWDPDDGGGALLDVGIYVLGPAVALWGPSPEVVEATSVWTERGVDASTEFVIAWSGGRRAVGMVSFVDDEAQTLEIMGLDHTISIDGDAFTGDPEVDPYREMVEAVDRDVRGIEPWPRPASEAIELLGLIERVASAARSRSR